MSREMDFTETCHALTKLAILKNTKIEEAQIALMAKYLLMELSYSDIIKACGYFAQRLPGFPDVAMFFNMIAPIESTDVTIERDIGHLFEIIRSGYDNFKESGVQLTELQKELLQTWSWTTLQKMNESDVSKVRTNMTFFLKKKIESDGNIKLSINRKALIDYRHAIKQLEQGGNSAIEEKFI